MGKWMETDGKMDGNGWKNGWFAHHVFFLCFNNFSSVFFKSRSKMIQIVAEIRSEISVQCECDAIVLV